MTRHLHIDLPVGKRHPQVLYPDQLGERVDLVDLLAAEWAQREEVGRHSPLSRFAPSLKKSRPIGFDRGREQAALRSRVKHTLVPGSVEMVGRPSRIGRKLHAATITRLISGDCFFLITGALVALDLCLIVWLSQR